MLVLARKQNQNIIIGDNIIVKVVRVTRDTVKLGIQAPATVPVHRQEVYDEIQKSNSGAPQTVMQAVPKLARKLFDRALARNHGSQAAMDNAAADHRNP